MRRPLAVLATLVTASALLAACGPDESDAVPEPTTPPPGTGVPAVSGGFGQAPHLAFPDGGAGAELVADTLVEGQGADVADGDTIVADYVAWVWPASATPTSTTTEPTSDTPTTTSTKKPKKTKTPKTTAPAGPREIISTFERGTPESFTIKEGAILPGMSKGLTGVAIGSRVLLVLPPAEAFGDQGSVSMGLSPGDTLVLVFDVLTAFDGDAAATGTPVEPEAGLPTVADGDSGPEITVPEADPPTELQTQVLIEGDGPEVETGQLILVQYRGVLWKDGTEFDSSWERGQPSGFYIGVGGVIKGWDTGLVGQKAGSRVLLVVPPADGYGEAGSPPKIAGDDTLVFVIDILGSWGDPKEPTESPTTSG